MKCLYSEKSVKIKEINWLCNPAIFQKKEKMGKILHAGFIYMIEKK